MRLNIYLLNDSIRDFASATRDAYLHGQKVHVLNAHTKLPYKTAAYVYQAPESRPKWASFLGSHYAVECVQTQAGFLLLLEARGRKFAVTFGAGYHLLDPEAIESSFGMRVCANTLDPGKVKTIDARNIDIMTRQARININAGTDLPGFDVDTHRNCVRSLSGTPSRGEMGKSLSGADALKITRDVSLDGLHDLCASLFEEYQKEDHKQKFPELAHSHPLRRQDPLVARLNAALDKQVRARDFAKLSMALPFMPEAGEASQFRFFRGAFERVFPALSPRYIDAFLRELPGVPDPLNQIKIMALNDDEEAAGPAHRLRDYLVAELVVDGALFVTTAGQWFSVEQDYARRIRARVAGIPDLTDRLKLPPMGLHEHEKDYNLRIAAARGWQCFDRKLFYGTGSERDQKIEVCDLLAPRHRFLCVKKMTSSASLSHLFAQGAISMELLKHEAKYRAVVVERAGKLARDGLRAPRPTVVFAIATEKPQSLADAMFLFSAVHLVVHLRPIAGADAGVALARIPLVEDPTVPATVRRGQKPA